MAGQQEVVFSQYHKLMSLLKLAVSSYCPDDSEIINNESSPRMQIRERVLRKKELVTSKDTEKEPCDRIHGLDSAMINHFMLMYGQDISGVKIHTGSYAENMTRKAGAEALTNGHDIYFSSGTFQPQTEEGHSLLLHEITHVKQFENKTRMTFREDKESVEHEAYKQEGLADLNTEETELFETLKQSDLIFKNQELQNNSDISEQDLEDFTRSERQSIIRYHSRSGMVYDLTPDEYKDGLKEIKEQLETDLEIVMMTGSEEEKLKCMDRMTRILSRGVSL